MIINKLQKNKAFTLIELMVATTIFSMVMLMGVGSLIVSSNSAKSAQRIRTAVDNVNFAMESMTRELRTGTYYDCGSDMTYDKAVANCPNGDDVILFKPQQVQGAKSRVGYYKKSRDGSNTSTLMRCVDSVNNCSPVVSEDVDVKLLKFIVKGSYLPLPNPSPNDTVQPSVEILMQGTVDLGGSNTAFSLQSMASQRSTEK